MQKKGCVSRSRSASNGMDNSEVFDRYYNLSLNYLSFRPRSEKEVTDYLTKKIKDKKLNLKSESDGDEIISKIIKKLKEYKFIDDTAFAKFWIEQRLKSKHKPIRAVEFELKQKGIHKEIINELLSEIESKDSDLNNAKLLADRKMDYYRNLPPDKRREKVLSFLMRKGFSYDTAKKALND
jgi:regulatory protein